MITIENYFSKENSLKYMGCSQFKDFMKCPKMAMAKINSDYVMPMTDALLMGKYFDAYFDGELEQFKTDYPQIFKRDGNLKATYEKLNDIIKLIETDPIFMKYNMGRQQVIYTGNIVGVPFKIMIDSLCDNCIVDRKLMEDFKDKYSDGEFKEWFRHWQYDIQGAIYQFVTLLNLGKKLPFLLAPATKEKSPDHDLIVLGDDILTPALEIVQYYAPRFQRIKLGLDPAIGCGVCDYCKSIKKCKEPILLG